MRATARTRFVSRSGRIVLEPDDWNLAYSVAVFKRPLPENHTATWRAVLRGLDKAQPQPTSPGVEDCITVAQGLPPGQHVLELRGVDSLKDVQAARFSPRQALPNNSMKLIERGWVLLGGNLETVVSDGVEFGTWSWRKALTAVWV